MDILAWIVLGLLAGAIAKAIDPQARGGGLVSTIILGIIGAFVGGSLGVFLQTGHFTLAATSLSLTGIGVAVIGAIIAVFVWNLLTRQTSL
ncbi:MAG: GlsB/YeaQ/YmgE family stress response membrane protein [Rhizonema sp. PD37]|nr:GlsB/YeaQ/YmgE family stress response membrane protein [Rhizonema sp. PD37]